MAFFTTQPEPVDPNVVSANTDRWRKAGTIHYTPDGQTESGSPNAAIGVDGDAYIQRRSTANGTTWQGWLKRDGAWVDLSLEPQTFNYLESAGSTIVNGSVPVEPSGDPSGYVWWLDGPVFSSDLVESGVPGIYQVTKFYTPVALWYAAEGAEPSDLAVYDDGGWEVKTLSELRPGIVSIPATSTVSHTVDWGVGRLGAGATLGTGGNPPTPATSDFWINLSTFQMYEYINGQWIAAFFVYNSNAPTPSDDNTVDYWIQGSGGSLTEIYGPRTVTYTVNDSVSDGDVAVYSASTDSWQAVPPATAVGTYVTNQINALIDEAPGALDTLNELAAALGDDENFASTVTNSLAGKAALAAANSFTVGGHTITSSAVGDIPLVLKGASGQTASLVELRNNSNVVRFSVSDAGYTSTENVQAGGGVRVGTAVSYTTNQRWLSVGNTASVPSAVSSGAIVYADGGHLFARSVDANVGLTRQVINPQTGTTYTLAAGDAGALVTLSNAAAITLTVPAEASVNYAVGTRIDLAQLGAGQVTVAGDSGVTVGSADAKLAFRVQYSSASLVKTGADTWLLVGDLA